MQPLLFLAHRIPYPPNKGDKIRSYHLLQFLADRYRVLLGTFIDDPADLVHVDRVRGMCWDARFVHLHPARARLRAMANLLSDKPLTVPFYRHQGLADWARTSIKRHGIERILVFSSCMAQFLPRERALSEVVDFVDVDSDKWRQYSMRKSGLSRAIYAREADRLLEWERAVAARATYSLFVTKAEADLFASLVPSVASRIVPVGNGVDIDFFAPDSSRPSPYTGSEEVVVFTGAMDYWPNIDAATWFAREVLPTVVQSVPEARFYIVGMNPAPAIRALEADDRVSVTGRVADVRPYLQHAAVVVAPLRLARGIQNKILEAMSMARPVVASSACARPLSAVPGFDLEVAEGADDFAAKTIALLRSTSRDSLGSTARARVARDYSWERSLSRVAELIEEAAMNQSRSSRGAQVAAADTRVEARA